MFPSVNNQASKQASKQIKLNKPESSFLNLSSDKKQTNKQKISISILMPIFLRNLILEMEKVAHD